MNKKTTSIGIIICALGLTSCYFSEDGESSYYQPYSYGQKPKTATSPLYPDGYDNTQTDSSAQVYQSSGNGPYIPGSRETVTVPDSYHTGSGQSPASFQARETSWVKRQNPQNYTIELDDSDKASSVASTLQKAPKDARKAEVKYDKGGERHYRGVYGTYSSYESAQKALNSLPDDLKQNARVKTWGSVQSNVN